MDILLPLQQFTILVNQFLLPELKNDLDYEIIKKEDFSEFRDNLTKNLSKFLNIVKLLLKKPTEDSIEMTSSLILMVCEQTSSNTLFQVETEILKTEIHILAGEYFDNILNNYKSVEAKVLDYYKSRLTSDKWKKQLGAIHGFHRFMQLRYGSQKCKIPNDSCSFILSVGLLFKDFYDPTYKNFGYQIIGILLKNCDIEHLRCLNIHNVIWDSFSLDISRIKSFEKMQNLWDCLLLCLEQTENIAYHKWNKVDELFEIIIREITFTSRADIREYFFKILLRLSITFAKDKHEIQLLLDQQKLDDLRILCQESTHTASYRWAKQILKLFISEANHLTEDYERCCALLKCMHHCYLICILPIPIEISQTHLELFLNLFTSALLVAYRCHNNRQELKEIVIEFLKTFLLHIDKTNNPAIIAYKTSCSKIIQDGVL